MNRSLLCCTVLMTSLAAAAPAAAQTFVEPSLNWQAFHVSSDTDAPAAKGYGFGFGKLAKTVNLETQIIYFPKLVETGGGTDVASSHAFYFGGGYVIGPEIRERVRVYGAIGFGELYRK